MGIAGVKLLVFFLLAIGNDALLVLKDKVGAADDDLFSLHHAGNAVGHDVLYLGVVLLVVQPPALGLLHHGVGNGVGVVLLQAGGQAQHLRLGVPAEGDDLGNRGGGVGQGAGLVKDDGIRLGHVLQEFAALHGDVVLGAFPHGGQHRNGHCQLQGTGEVHHEHGQGLGDIPGEQIGQGRTAQGIGHQLVRQMGGAGLCGGLELFGILNHFHDSVVPSAALGLLHLDDAFALLGHGAGIDEAACLLGHGL